MNHVRGVVFFLAGLTIAASAQTPVGYFIRPIPVPLGFSFSRAVDFGANGDVVCNAYGTTNRVFVWHSNGTITILPLPNGAAEGEANGVSPSGWIAGNDSHSQAIGWTPQGQPLYIGRPGGFGGCSALSVNSSGTFLVRWVVGTEQVSELWTTSTGFFGVLSPLTGYEDLRVHDICDDGTVLGESFTDEFYTDYQATEWDSQGTATPLVKLGNNSSIVYCGINKNLVAGHCGFDENPGVPTLWTSGQPTAMPAANSLCKVEDINSNIQSVGSISNDGAYFWQGTSFYRNLNEWIDLRTPGWFLGEAVGIEESGRIVGSGLQWGVQRDFLADPVYEVDVPVQNLTVNFGYIDFGEAQSLGAVDGDVLRMRPFIVPNLNVAPVTFTVSGSTPYYSVSSLRLNVVSRMGSAGVFRQKLELYDFQLNRFDPVDVSDQPLNTEFHNLSLYATGDLSRYMRTSDGMFRARLSVRQAGPTATLAWFTDFDLIKWFLKP